MRRLTIGLFVAVSMLAVPATADAAGAAKCRDAKGHFMKGPPKPAMKPAAAGKMAGKCRNAKGQFAKCGTAGAKPA